jgi:GNAT superfamily N-acetyltransferase
VIRRTYRNSKVKILWNCRFRVSSRRFQVNILPIPTEATYALRRSVLWHNTPHDRTIYHPDDTRAFHFGAFLNGDAPELSPGPVCRDECIAVISLYVENAHKGPGSQATNPPDNGSTCGEGSNVVMAPKEEFDSVEESGSGSRRAGVRWRKAHFRRFVTAPEYQRRGVGRELLLHAFRFAEHELAAVLISSHARLDLKGWYEGFGMRPVGEVWKLFDGDYITMQREF